MPVAPRIVNKVSYAICDNHEHRFTWHAQYLVTLVGEYLDGLGVSYWFNIVRALT